MKFDFVIYIASIINFSPKVEGSPSFRLGYLHGIYEEISLSYRKKYLEKGINETE